MAQRRMFSKDITEHDSFLEMPLSTQALYFHLGMQADDDGFVSPNRIMRMIGCQLDDLKVLIGKKFVLAFEDGIVVIKHWKMNNYIQRDRYKETVHAEKLALLQVKTNGSYKLDTECIQNVHAGKVRIGKDRLGEVIQPSAGYSSDFEEFWKQYPKKVGKGAAWSAWKKAKPPALAVLFTTLTRQKNSDQWRREQGRFIPNPATWINQRRWDDEVEEHVPDVWIIN